MLNGRYGGRGNRIHRNKDSRTHAYPDQGTR